MMNLMGNKKAQGANYLAVIVVLIMFGFFSILAYVMWQTAIDAFTAGGYNNGIVGTSISAWTQAFAAADYVIVFLMIFLIIGIGVTSFKVPTRNITFILTLIIGAFWGFISYFFNFMFIQMISPEIFATALGIFPRTLAICTNLHWVTLVMIIVGSLTLFGKKEKGQFLT